MAKDLVASKRASLKVGGKAEIMPNLSLLCPLNEIEERRDRRLEVKFAGADFGLKNPNLEQYVARLNTLNFFHALFSLLLM